MKTATVFAYLPRAAGALGAVVLAGLIAFPAHYTHAATLDWDGGGGDGLYSTAANWNPNQAPAANDTLNIATGATVSHENNLPFNNTINLTGSSTLSTVTSVIRLNSANLTVGSGSTLTGAFWDLDDADITFNDGAVANMNDWENKDFNTFTFNLGSSGFTTLNPTNFRFGNGSQSWNFANSTYQVDLASYTGGTQTITLVDYGSDPNSRGSNANFQTATHNILNAGSTYSVSLSWNDATEAIQAAIDVVSLTWDGGAGDGEWKSANNWNPNELPNANDTVTISGATVNWDQDGGSGQFLPSNLTVNLDNSTMTTSAGEVIRLSGSTINVDATSTLTGNFWDLNNGSVFFEDGAQANMASWELKGINTIGFELGASGFTTLTPTNLFLGSAPSTNTTYQVDLANYTAGTQAGIVLMDFNSHFFIDSSLFDSISNLNLINLPRAGYQGTIYFDELNSQILLDLDLVVPEPSTVALLGLGGWLLYGWRRRRRP